MRRPWKAKNKIGNDQEGEFIFNGKGGFLFIIREKPAKAGDQKKKQQDPKLFILPAFDLFFLVKHKKRRETPQNNDAGKNLSVRKEIMARWKQKAKQHRKKIKEPLLKI